MRHSENVHGELEEVSDLGMQFLAWFKNNELTSESRKGVTQSLSTIFLSTEVIVLALEPLQA